MSETQYCAICKEDHAVEEFEHIGGGWNGRYNYFTLKCLRTGDVFTVEFEDVE